MTIDRFQCEALDDEEEEEIREPGEGEYVDMCHYSKTGWAIWVKDGGHCTCHPANPPARQEPDHG